MELYGFIGMVALFAIVIYIAVVMSKSNVHSHEK